MSLIDIKPRGFFTKRKFSISESGTAIGEIDCALLKDEGQIRLGQSGYSVGREHLLSGSYFIEADGKRIVSADKPSALPRSFTMQIGGTTYTLAAASALGRIFILKDGEQEVGTIQPAAFFGRKSIAQLPDALPLEAKAFLIWLAVLMWKKSENASSSNN